MLFSNRTPVVAVAIEIVAIMAILICPAQA